MLEDIFMWAVGIGIALLCLAVAAVIVVAIYFSLTGGWTYQERVKVDGVTCIVTRDRLDDTIKDTSCPVVRRPHKPEVRTSSTMVTR